MLEFGRFLYMQIYVLVAKKTQKLIWCHQGLNPGPQAPEADALPLCYEKSTFTENST